MYLFFYGTLRRGGALHSKLEGVAEYVGSYKTSPKYSMYDVGCPILSGGGATSIVGDIFKVESMVSIAHIHLMELAAGYTLERIDVPGIAAEVFAYFQTPEDKWNAPLISSGDWLIHDNQQ